MVLGNLESERDWGHAKDYVEAMWLMMQQDVSSDFVIATGETRTVKEMVEYVFHKLNLDWTKYTQTDKKFERPEELNYLRGDPAKAKKVLNWNPKYTFKTMMDEMIDYWMKILQG